MSLSRTILAIGLALAAAAASAQGYPEKPLRIIAPFPPGGNVDIHARVIAAGLAEVLGQTVLVDNRGGAGGMIGAEAVAKAPPDGYTLLLGSNGPVSIGPLLYSKAAYEPLRDFAPITLLSVSPMTFALHPSIPAKNVKELIALLKARPGKVTMATAGTGTSNHLAGELFQSMTGTKMVHVPYKGSGPALVDVLGGQVDLIIDQVASSIAHIRAGKLRPIAVTTDKRATVMPDVPTFDEAGLKGYEASTYAALLAPANTPKDVVAKLNAATLRVLGTNATKERFAQMGAEPAGNSSEQFAAFLKQDVAKWAKVIKEGNIKVE
jgi:tripartite-type tricarboxylate transporter receptor subunit TctC